MISNLEANHTDPLPLDMPAVITANAPPIAPDINTDTSACEQCGGIFTPRKGNGGKPQRFCSTDCRIAFNAQRSQRSPTCSSETELPPVSLIPEAEIAAAGPARFDWVTDDSVILHKQPTTAVYWNGQNQVVIRQEAEWNEDDDPFLHFDPHNLPALIAKLQAEYDSWKHHNSQR